MSEMKKTPGQILYESVYSTLFWSDQDEETRAIYEKDAAAVIALYEATEVAGLRAQLAQVQGELERVRGAIPLDGLDDSLDEVRVYKDDPIRGVVEWSAINRTIAWIRNRAALTPTTPKEANRG